MKELVAKVLHQNLPKDKLDTFSQWTQSSLTERQKKYAALDVIKAMEIYEELLKFPDLTIRLSKDQAKEIGFRVDIVLSLGDVASMATRAATGRVVGDEFWMTPNNQAKKATSSQVVVEIDNVFASALRIPRLKEKGVKISLGHFGVTPFKIALPRTMLKPHIVSPSIRIYKPSHQQADSTSNYVIEDDNEDSIEAITADTNHDISAEIAVCGLQLAKDTLASGTLQQDTLFPLEDEVKLDPPPSYIDDCASSILGCGFHKMDRPKTPICHEMKKSYYVAYQNALYCWDEKILEAVMDVLQKDGMSTEDIDHLMYYNAEFFKKCVPRVILPPTRLYWRVRAVF